MPTLVSLSPLLALLGLSLSVLTPSTQPAAPAPQPAQGPGHPTAAGTPPPGALNLTYMRRASYTVASSSRLRQFANLGGWADSGNRPRLVGAAEAGPRTLRVTVDAAASTSGGPASHRLRIINGSTDTVLFGAQDSQLSLNLQALDRQGQWQDIEYVPRSWCGNSYHTVFLAPDQYWQLTAPVYTGEFATKLRAKLLRQDPQNPGNTLAVYSNEFEGRVNPGQFGRKEGHAPQDIMDPYNE
ncbi:hypothetical protein LJ737_19510 [Hymenobacter sp. 15J16-1T3B]|uniref:hypothetical protein n=1 Tax=Hymenobacter sp. 15J16-1T3B TaxID=2886941 RepID=UPI001D0FD849|nr:hypothetical protein [Hymenobacter sp. 15J16-1T3B]MCC3159438.1 hypothetical protein [Hymenobacter sp. 15J16-1T3B]